MTGAAGEEKPLNIKGLIGVGLDGQPPDLHVTRGENFYMYGGSRQTHQQMVDSALRFNDEVDKRGKKIDQINARELDEIARNVWQDR